MSPPALENFTFEEQLAVAQSIQGGARLHLCIVQNTVSVSTADKTCSFDAVRALGICASHRCDVGKWRDPACCLAYRLQRRSVMLGQLTHCGTCVTWSSGQGCQVCSSAHVCSPVHSHEPDNRPLMPCLTVCIALAFHTYTHVAASASSLHLHQFRFMARVCQTNAECVAHKHLRLPSFHIQRHPPL